MRITQEADYALRMAYCLAKTNKVTDAGSIAAQTGVTPRFALKILRKLSQGGIVRSYKGAYGGYMLAAPPEDISMKDIVEQIDGPIAMLRCFDENHVCSATGPAKGGCVFHHVFRKLNEDVSERLDRVKLSMLIDDDMKLDDIMALVG